MTSDAHRLPPPGAIAPVLVRDPSSLLERRSEALSAGDVATAHGLHEAAAVLLPFDLSPASGNALRSLLASLAAYKRPVRISAQRCDVVGSIALLTARLDLHADLDDGPIVIAADITAVARRDAGTDTWHLLLERWDPTC